MNIGFVSTRFRGLDGVSLEADKWASVLKELDHRCFWFAGELDRDPRVSMRAAEAFFGHPAALELNRRLFGATRRSRQAMEALQEQKAFLKKKLYAFVRKFRLDLLIAENALSIPMNLGLGSALAELIAETGMPAIAHHHDFAWERPRFLVNACQDVLNSAFPPDLPSIRHVVINSMAGRDLAGRRGLSSRLIPNVMDYENGPPPPLFTGRRFRQALGFAPQDILILQPTRIVARKGIEQAVNLIQRLNLKAARLIVTHEAGDEGQAYGDWIKGWAQGQGVPLHLIHDRLGEKGLSLGEAYAHADLVTYPSLQEGFGNAFLEAVYYKRPILVNRYPVFITDLEPKGFKVVAIDGYLTDAAVRQAAGLLRDPSRGKAMAEHNFKVARRHFSFTILRRELSGLISELF